MDKTEWIITENHWDYKVEKMLFTYDENEMQENRFNKFIVEQERKGWCYFVIEEQQLALWFSEAEAMMFNFIDGFTKSWKYFWFSTKDICKKTHWWKDKVIDTIKSLEEKWYVIRDKKYDRFWNERRFLSTTPKYSLELLKLRGVSENQIGGVSENQIGGIGKSDRGVSENPTHSIIYSNINSNLSSEWESETQKTQTRGSRKDTNSTSSTKEWNPPTPQQLLEAYENEKQLVQMIWNSKAVLERAEFKQAKKSKAYKTISWFIQQLYGKVGTVRFWEVRWDTWARFEYAVNRAKEYDWKDIFRTEKDEREYQFYKKSLYLNKQENE